MALNLWPVRSAGMALRANCAGLHQDAVGRWLDPGRAGAMTRQQSDARRCRAHRRAPGSGASCHPWTCLRPGSEFPCCALCMMANLDDRGARHGLAHVRLGRAGLEKAHESDGFAPVAVASAGRAAIVEHRRRARPGAAGPRDPHNRLGKRRLSLALGIGRYGAFHPQRESPHALMKPRSRHSLGRRAQSESSRYVVPLPTCRSRRLSLDPTRPGSRIIFRGDRRVGDLSDTLITATAIQIGHPPLMPRPIFRPSVWPERRIGVGEDGEQLPVGQQPATAARPPWEHLLARSLRQRGAGRGGPRPKPGRRFRQAGGGASRRRSPARPAEKKRWIAARRCIAA